MPIRHRETWYLGKIGEITVRWNYLEIDFCHLGYAYLGGDKEIASRIFGGMRNVTLSEFIEFLSKKLDSEDAVRDRVKHAIQSFNVIRENRNTVQHAIPMVREAIFLERIKKTNSTGTVSEFSVSADDIRTVISDMDQCRKFIRRLCNYVTVRDAEPPHDAARKNAHEEFLKMLSLPEKPPLPRRINPLQPPSMRLINPVPYL